MITIQSRLYLLLTLVSIIVVGCTSQSLPTLANWSDSLSCQSIDMNARLSIADSIVYNCSETISPDSVAHLLLTEDVLDKDLNSSSYIVFDKAKDNRALMMTITGTGSSCTSTTFVLYRKEDGTTTVKKVAGVKPCDEGGMELPAQYQDITVNDWGYTLHGVSSFYDYHDTLFVRKSFLESDSVALY